MNINKDIKDIEDVKNEETNKDNINIEILENNTNNEIEKNYNNIDINININKEQNIINKEKIEKNSLTNSKKNFNINNNNNNESKEGVINRESNKKGKKAYLNFIQNIKKANKNKKNKVKNLLEVDPKIKLSKAPNKISILNKAFINTYKDIHKDENVKELENPKKEEEKIISNSNVYDTYTEELKKGYTGFILLKQNQGANIFQIKLEGTLEEINNIFKTHKIEIDGGPVELIHTKELEELRSRGVKNENEKNKKMEIEKINNIGIKETKETKEEPLLAAVRKKAMENEIIKKEEDDIKIKEMKEKIQKYKFELKKGTEFDEYMLKGRKDRLSCHMKNTRLLEGKLKEFVLRKKSSNEDEEIFKNIKSSKQNITLKNDKNNISNISNINIIQNEEFKNIKNEIDTKQYNTIGAEEDIKKEKKEEKEKERDKSYSRAMDRFKKRYKKDNNSQEFKNKRSDKISEMAKKLENVIGKPSEQEEIKIETNNEIIHENEIRNNFEEILENQPIIHKKPKKPKKFQF